MKDQIYDFIIIGGGIAGVSLAYRLAPNASVLLLEQESQPGYHASGRSAAMFMETYGTPQIQALTRAGRLFFENAKASGFSEEDILIPRGCMYLGAKEDEAKVRAQYEEALKASDNVELINTEKIMDLVPCMRADKAYLAMYEAKAEDMEVHNLLTSFIKHAKAHGTDFKNKAELLKAEYKNKSWQLTLADGTLAKGRVLVNAAGAWVDEVAKRSGVKPIGFEPRRRTAFTFTAPNNLDLTRLTMTVGINEDWYIKPDAGQILGSPANADVTVPHDVVAEELDVAIGIHNIQENTTLEIRRPNHTWAGLRTFSPDNDLVIGFDKTMPQFFWLAGQGGYGIQSSAGNSELAATLLLEQSLSENLIKEQVNSELISPNRYR